MPRKRARRFNWTTPFRWLLWTAAIVLLCISLLLLAFRSGEIPTTAFMLQHQWQEDRPIRHQWLALAEISTPMQLAVMAAEDGGFADHHGIEWYATRAALSAALQGERAPGGSTITQQVAKNLFLWPGRSFVRKGVELLLAPLIELVWNKRRILEVYLNIAQFSAQDYGIAAASRHLLNKSAKHLGRYDAARLAALLPSPRRYSVNQPTAYLRSQQRKILGNMQILEAQRTLQALQ